MTTLRRETPTLRTIDRPIWGSFAVYGLAFIIGLANLPKPMHIDDTLYVRIAQQVVRRPLDPYGGTLNWQHVPLPTYKVSISPPLLSYYFAAVIALAGDSPFALHAAMMPWLLSLAWGLLHLGRRFTCCGARSALLVLSSPAVCVGTNLMLDTPLVAAMTFAAECFLRGLEGRGRRWLVAAGIAASAASLIKYPGLALILFFLVVAAQKRRPVALVVIAAPVLAVFLWQQWSGEIYGASQLAEAQSFLNRFQSGFGRTFVERLLEAAALIATTFPIWILSATAGRSRTWAVLVASLLTLLGWLLLPAKSFNAPFLLAFLACLFVGVFGLAEALLTNFRFRESTRRFDVRWAAFAWFAGIGLLTAISAPFVAVRYFLPLEPPLAWIALRGPTSRSRDAALNAALAVSLVLSGLLGWVDYRWAAFYPALVKEIRELHPQRTVFFCGHWGWQWYAENAGFHAWNALAEDAPAGAILAMPLRADRTPVLPKVLRRLRPLEMRSAPVLGLTTWMPDEGLRLYGGDYPHLPWGLTSRPAEEAALFEVGP